MINIDHSDNNYSIDSTRITTNYAYDNRRGLSNLNITFSFAQHLHCYSFNPELEDTQPLSIDDAPYQPLETLAQRVQHAAAIQNENLEILHKANRASTILHNTA